jgi:hypothetical protein
MHLLVHPNAMQAIDRGLSPSEIVATFRVELSAFAAKREKYLLYVAGDCAKVAR